MEEPAGGEARTWKWTTMVSSTFFLLCLIGLSHEGSQKVFKGTECIPHSQLWQEGLFEGTQLRCGGVLIDRRWVLTAARCSNSRYWLSLGEHSLSQMDWTKQIRHSGLSVTHPGYQAALQNQDNDLRLLQLGIPVLLTRSIQPLPLPTTCAVAGTRCHISGWGTTNHTRNQLSDRLQCLNLSIVSNATCRAAFPGRITDNMVCAGGIAGEDACQPLQELEREFLLRNEWKGNLRWERVRGDCGSCGSIC
ncbi:kallikrein-12 isoform X2 [Sagmatias obliquidens]|uniref:kallikrein-12 isoform X2 n=1 Tax=Sagmatias obliquidens TaxID=3371155 RepID=UPI000F440316|nr:kallikrein-12 isoform X2 [Lagenorhynchus obliquidens]